MSSSTQVSQPKHSLTC